MGSSTLINTPFLCKYHMDKLMMGDKYLVEYSDHGGLFIFLISGFVLSLVHSGLFFDNLKSHIHG